ncbi:AraC family transcriptional regulator ligand-binding domain-containing protein [Mycolicibacterium sp. BiH015]|uniref:AraC family transcriptional regulator n=1 Tax=Mycolicibacterium sp. BiH015 TaxID=3018808 RepID=UPI0022E1AD46|nr:AraC family transcriptional regulator [Mycolicibacterium sp. BiH015]MDA2892091.1 AraC family transcriptional regulator ligand-binding domain-containing protein [Mycolicibacterium sp. BiH015]
MTSQSYALDTTWRTLLRDLGVAPADVLRRAGLADDLFQHPSTRLAPLDYYRLWNSIEAETKDPALPVSLCRAVRAESFSPPLFAALCSPNFMVAAQRIAHYKKLVAPMRFGVTEHGDLVTVELSWLDAPRPPASLIMMELLFCVALIRLGTREAIRPVEVTAAVLPEVVTPYEEFLGAPLRRAQSHAVTVSATDAALPFLTSNEPLWAAFEPELRRRLADLETPASTTERVRAALLEALPSGLASMDTVARKLTMSKRTLQRRIEVEGTTYQQILDATRSDLATHYLENTMLSIAEISFLLGFAEPNSFYRAFRVWTGSTPDMLRRAT